MRLSERTIAGMARTKAQGTKLGAPSKSKELVAQVRQLKAEGQSNGAIARAFHISPSTVAKYLAEWFSCHPSAANKSKHGFAASRAIIDNAQPAADEVMRSGDEKSITFSQRWFNKRYKPGH